MKRPKLRALVLSAGFGTRLRPLTHFLPKPLLPVAGEPLVGHTLKQLAALGCEVAVLNLHHLADEIPATLGKLYHGMPLRYSLEEEIQGTLGALVPPRQTLGRADVVMLVNGDSLCAWPWKQLLRRHFKSAADVTLLVHRRSPDVALGGGVGLDRSGAVIQIRDMEPLGEVASRHVFAGVHLISPRLLESLTAGPGDIISDLYMPLLAQGKKIVCCITGRRWHDLGTPRRYLDACLEQMQRPWWRGRRSSNVSPLAQVATTAQIDRSMVEEGTVVEEEVQLSRSLLLPGAEVGRGSVIVDSIIGPGVVLPASTRVEKRVVHRQTMGHQTSENETVLGDLIYTPLN